MAVIKNWDKFKNNKYYIPYGTKVEIEKGYSNQKVVGKIGIVVTLRHHPYYTVPCTLWYDVKFEDDSIETDIPGDLLIVKETKKTESVSKDPLLECIKVMRKNNVMESISDLDKLVKDYDDKYRAWVGVKYDKKHINAGGQDASDYQDVLDAAENAKDEAHAKVLNAFKNSTEYNKLINVSNNLVATFNNSQKSGAKITNGPVELDKSIQQYPRPTNVYVIKKDATITGLDGTYEDVKTLIKDSLKSNNFKYDSKDRIWISNEDNKLQVVSVVRSDKPDKVKLIIQYKI